MTHSKWMRALQLAALMLVISSGLAMGQTPPSSQQSPEPEVLLSFGTGVNRQTRDLTGQAETFSPETERVFCRMHIKGAEAPTTLTHAWYYEGKTMAQVDLNIGSSNWRTWSSKRLLPSWTGLWEVKVLDQAGKVLATASFNVE